MFDKNPFRNHFSLLMLYWIQETTFLGVFWQEDRRLMKMNPNGFIYFLCFSAKTKKMSQFNSRQKALEGEVK